VKETQPSLLRAAHLYKADQRAILKNPTRRSPKANATAN
jgi:hypothetical protein